MTYKVNHLPQKIGKKYKIEVFNQQLNRISIQNAYPTK